MKLYWPNAIRITELEEEDKLWTYDSCLSIGQCKDVFKTWEDPVEGYGFKLLSMWIDVTDPDDSSYKGRIEVRRDYLLYL